MKFRAVLPFLAVVGCSDASGPDLPRETQIDGLTYTAFQEIVNGQVLIFVTAHNRSNATISRDVSGPCGMRPRFYRGDKLAWDGAVAFPNCPNDVVRIQLAANDSSPRMWGSSIGPSVVLGDSLPSGEYRSVALIRPFGKDGATTELLAGRVTLSQ